MMWGYGTGWGGWLLMTLIMVAFWALVIFGIVALFRGPVRPGPRRADGGGGDAQRILDERFARGEINAEEYHSRQSLLPPAR
jgi:putative membrane protein